MKTWEANYTQPAQALFASAVEVVARQGWKITDARPEASVLSFNSGRSWRTSEGADITATFLERDGGTVVIVGARVSAEHERRLGTGRFDLGEKKAVASKFLTELDKLV